MRSMTKLNAGVKLKEKLFETKIDVCFHIRGKTKHPEA